MMRFCLLGYLLLTAAFLSVYTDKVALAVSDEFTVKLFVGTDTTPPTTPVLQSATAIAASQINLLWLPATDDVLLSGYRVYRDGVPIATTTLTSFSDSGLTPSTFYSYTIDAYDSFENVSSSSNALGTSTLAVVVVVPPATTTPATNGTQSGTQMLAVRNLNLTPFVTGATLSWQTTLPSRYIVQWGRTTSYEGGAVSSNLFVNQHQTEINDLEPGTVYYYSLQGIDTRGVGRVLSTGTFTTFTPVITSLPISVRNFTVVVKDTDVSLSWSSGELPEGSVVRIVRSHLTYPTSPTDGALVYEGRGQAAVDQGALLLRSPQYYTAFVIARDGTVSSGALAVAGKETSPLPAVITEVTPVVETGDPEVLLAPAIMIIQGTTKVTFDSIGSLSADSPYLISIPIAALQPGIKSIIVSVQDPTDQRLVSTYLLKLNKLGDAYEAFIPAPPATGQARISVEVYNYSAENVRQITTTITFKRHNKNEVVFPDELTADNVVGIVVLYLGMLILLFLWWRFTRAPREDNR